jgi:hypothetical protein
MSDPNVTVKYRPDGTMDIYNGPINGPHSHTVIGPDGRIKFDRGVDSNGQRTVFNNDDGSGPFSYNNPFVPPANPFIPPNPFGK